jgi:hypothetical protein
LTPKLDLVICATEVLKRSVVEDTDEIASAIYPLSICLEKGKSFVGQFGTIEIAISNERSRDTQLTRGASQDRQSGALSEDERAHVVELRPDIRGFTI